MAKDLVRAGITCKVTRTRVRKVRAPQVHMELVIPEDARRLLVITRDGFASGPGKRECPCLVPGAFTQRHDLGLSPTTLSGSSFLPVGPI
ncbi:hypothetical protein GCM10017750_43080 [Streptomyces racemochromogenes]